MSTIKLTQENYTDYNGVDYLRSLGCKTISFNFKYAPETEHNPVPAILIHVSGSMPTGERINTDFWPQRDFTEEDFKVIFTDDMKPKFSPEDIGFRIGYREVDEVNKETGEISKVLKVSKPRWLDFSINGQVYELNGDRRQFIEKKLGE